MVVFKKALPRRTFLRGMGGVLALPLLDAMIPAFAAGAGKSPVRLGTVYVPNGMWPMDKWTPKVEGAAFELSPTLEALAPFRQQLLVLSGLAHKEAMATAIDPGAPHAHTLATFLTGVRPKPTSGKDMQVGISMDQMAAKKLGKETQLASLEVSLFLNDLVGNCEPGFTCTYVNTLSWRTPTTPLPMEHNPRALFERLFGDSDNTDRASRLARIKDQRSILDGMTQRASRFTGELGAGDRAKLNEYLDAIRDTERRIQIAEKETSHELPELHRPTGIPASFEAYAKLMFELQVLAYQTDLTRVVTFMIAHERSVRTYSEIGVPDSHHPLSHHRGNPKSIESLIQINTFHVKLFVYLLERLRSTADGDGSLLDHTLLLYGSGLSDGNLHTTENLPLLLAGGGLGKGGRHVRYPPNTPLSNLFLTMLDKVGTPLDSFADSTGKVDLLSAV